MLETVHEIGRIVNRTLRLESLPGSAKGAEY
jgi:hypothetical protein